MAREWNFGSIVVRHGTPARREIEITWEDDSPREIVGTGYLRVYSDSGSTLLFPEVALLDGDSLSKRIVSLTAAQCTWPRRSGGYYAEIEFRDGSGSVIADTGYYGKFEFAGS